MIKLKRRKNSSVDYLLILNEKIIGGVKILRHPGNTGHIGSVHIRSNYRGRGYGTILMQHVLHRLNRAGNERATLHVRVNNNVAINLYKKMGFEFTESVLVETGPGTENLAPLLEMSREI